MTRKIMQTNFYGPLRRRQLCIPLMRQNNYGRIVNSPSTPGSLAEMADPESDYADFHPAAYRRSKNAINGVTALLSEMRQFSNIFKIRQNICLQCK